MEELKKMKMDDVLVMSVEDAKKLDEYRMSLKGGRTLDREDLLELHSKDEDVKSKLQMNVENYMSLEGFKNDVANRVRNWIRDTMDEDKWGDTEFTNKEVLDKDGKLYDQVPVDKRNLINNIEEQMKLVKKQTIIDMKVKYPEIYEWMRSIKGIKFKFPARFLHRVGWMKNFPTHKHLWSHSRLDGEGWRSRPGDHELQTICCYLLGDTAIKKASRGDSKYGDIKFSRRGYENKVAEEKGWCGKTYQDYEEDIKRLKKGKATKACYPKGKIRKVIKELKEGKTDKPGEAIQDIREHAKKRTKCTDSHITGKCTRYAVKTFLRDFWIKKQKIKKKLGYEYSEGINCDI